jgi:hypothetical protein
MTNFLQAEEIKVGDLIQVMRHQFGELNGDVVVDGDHYYQKDVGIVLNVEIGDDGLYDYVEILSNIWDSTEKYWFLSEYFAKWE